MISMIEVGIAYATYRVDENRCRFVRSVRRSSILYLTYENK